MALSTSTTESVTVNQPPPSCCPAALCRRPWVIGCRVLRAAPSGVTIGHVKRISRTHRPRLSLVPHRHTCDRRGSRSGDASRSDHLPHLAWLSLLSGMECAQRDGPRYHRCRGTVVFPAGLPPPIPVGFGAARPLLFLSVMPPFHFAGGRPAPHPVTTRAGVRPS